ncbi:CDGSH iron-sulfur domain-containing protein [Streptomyces tardus]|uniref:CDGSH iron-sulfur domain-containing protein n=1 Tax=Streptomyces tardus TaxID=2780544 RepID=UPI003557C4B9
MLVEGPVEVCLPGGGTARSDRFLVAICMCRKSACYPWCDTSHRRRQRRGGPADCGAGPVPRGTVPESTGAGPDPEDSVPTGPDPDEGSGPRGTGPVPEEGSVPEDGGGAGRGSVGGEGNGQRDPQ